jgi:lysophospholipase L1-like esterase
VQWFRVVLTALWFVAGCANDTENVPFNDAHGSDVVAASRGVRFVQDDVGLEIDAGPSMGDIVAPNEPDTDPSTFDDVDRAIFYDVDESALDDVDDAMVSADADSTGALPVAPGPSAYPSDRIHSPVTPWVVERWQSIVAMNSNSQTGVFMKVGDSISISQKFLHCFSGSDLDWGWHGDLISSHGAFLETQLDSTDSFGRSSHATKGGRNAKWAIAGSPSPLEQEYTAISPRYAVVMFGTNDIGYYGDDVLNNFRIFSDAMRDLLDELTEHGVLAMLMTIPPRTKKFSLGRWTRTANLFLRGLAQDRQLPFVDYHEALMELPSYGVTSDGVHPNAFNEDGKTQACVFSEAGLQYGYNMRNLVTMQSLDRIRRYLDLGQEPLDDTEPLATGGGTVDDPFVISQLPFVTVADTNESQQQLFDGYPECDTGQDESGPEFIYRLELEEQTALRAMVLDWDSTDVDVHLLTGQASTTSCLKRNDVILEGTLAPGVYHFSLDTYVSSGGVHAGEFLFLVLPCDPEDSACDAPLDGT